MKTNLQKMAGNDVVRNSRGFTLIELLVVIAIMAVIAGFTLVVVTGIKKKQYLSMAKAEMEQIGNALLDYHNKYGSYPPSNANLNPAVNTLYYELNGVTHNLNAQTYTTLDGACTISEADYKSAFTTIDGIINCTKGGGEDGTTAINFLKGLKANRLGTSSTTGKDITNLITSVRGPDASFKPLGVPDLNPFLYAYPGTNNPDKFDLWIDLKFGGKTNRICNWRNAPFVL